jgi:sugar lactone lactonase YvrE
MTPVWLYSSDGRKLAYVLVPVPQPDCVTYQGRYFSWSGEKRHYEEMPQAYTGAAALDAYAVQAEVKPGS